MPLPLTTPPERICILRLSAIGDVTHVLPTVRSIQHQWPDTKITWIIGKLEHQLVCDIPGIEFIIFDKSHGWSAYKKLRQQLSGYTFDVLLHMQISLRASFASLFIKAPVKLGFDKARAKNFQSLFCNYQISPPSPRQHVLDSLMEFALALGIDNKIIEWNIPVPESALDFIQQNISAEKYIAINPCTSARSNNWRNLSVQTYADVIDQIYTLYNLPCVLTGGPSKTEIDFADEIENLAEHTPINLVGQSQLKDLLAILDKAEAMIAPDTGPLHMANACGTPVIGLYASSNPERTGPYSNLSNTVNKYPEAVQHEFHQTVEEIKWGQRVRDPDVMGLITPDDILQKLTHILTQSE
jgi:heptosyltransferase I